MKVAIVGAGAVGGVLAAHLAKAAGASRDGPQVSVLARGATRDALRAHGWRVQEGADPNAPVWSAPVHAVADDAATLGPQDLVVIAVKAPALPALAGALGPLLGPHTRVLTAMNGVPWWFCQGQAAVGDAPLASVDPDGAVSAAIARERVIGCVVHLAASVVAPGWVRHAFGRQLILGDAAGGRSASAQRVVDLFQAAGFEVTHSADVRQDIWFKLWGNLTMNPASALTGATLDQLLADPLVRRFCSDAMREAAEVGARIGCPIAQTPEDRHAITAKLGAFKTSMLQDVEAGRAIELDGIAGAVHEIARRVGVATPNVDALFGLVRLFGRVRGLYPSAAA